MTLAEAGEDANAPRRCEHPGCDRVGAKKGGRDRPDARRRWCWRHLQESRGVKVGPMLEEGPVRER
jgi:hypothetical protein